VAVGSVAVQAREGTGTDVEVGAPQPGVDVEAGEQQPGKEEGGEDEDEKESLDEGEHMARSELTEAKFEEIEEAEGCDLDDLRVCCQSTKLTANCKITQVGEQQCAMRCKQKLRWIQHAQTNDEWVPPKHKKTSGDEFAACRVLDDPTHIEKMRNIGPKSNLKLKTITVAKGSRGTRGSPNCVAMCDNEGCLIAAHYGPAKICWNEHLTSDKPPAAAPTRPKRMRKSSVNKPAASAAPFAAPMRKDPAKPKCFGSTRGPICNCGCGSNALRIRLCDHPKTCGPWFKACKVCKANQPE